jgi:hypothetical protein
MAKAKRKKATPSVSAQKAEDGHHMATRIAGYVDGLALRAHQINEQVRALIDHPGEKGRAAEHIVRGLVREILPRKFSIGTGLS